MEFGIPNLLSKIGLPWLYDRGQPALWKDTACVHVVPVCSWPVAGVVAGRVGVVKVASERGGP